jgi:predicted transcriptional regulator
MKHDEVVAALKIIADTGIVAGISKDNIEDLKQYNLIVEERGNKETKYTSYELTKKGRVMLKANSKPDPLP